jgi:hypothetical protein
VAGFTLSEFVGRARDAPAHHDGAARHSGVIERHRGSRAQPSVIRAVTPRLTRDMHAESGSDCGKPEN